MGLLRRLRRLLLSDFGPPPSPDETDLPTFSGEKVVETIYSEGRERRLFVTQDDRGIYRVYVQWWDTSDWQAGYGARWAGGRSSGLSDSIEMAREMANETLRSTPLQLGDK
jgi:hypothetical protein